MFGQPRGVVVSSRSDVSSTSTAASTESVPTPGSLSLSPSRTLEMSVASTTRGYVTAAASPRPSLHPVPLRDLTEAEAEGTPPQHTVLVSAPVVGSVEAEVESYLASARGSAILSVTQSLGEVSNMLDHVRLLLAHQSGDVSLIGVQIESAAVYMKKGNAELQKTLKRYVR